MSKDNIILDNDILTESQKNELKGVIDSLVEERVQDIMKSFINKYTGFIVESATQKILGSVKNGVVKKINEETDKMKKLTERVVRSVVLEASEKIEKNKKATKQLVEDFKKTAPKLIERLAEEKANLLAEEALENIEKSKKSMSLMEGIVKGLEESGYVINEDIEQVKKKSKNEILKLKTEAIKAKRDLRVAVLTEGMLPNQKSRVIELLEEYKTAEKVDQVFNKIRNKVIEENTFVKQEEKKPERQATTVISEDDNFDSLLGASMKFMRPL